MEDETKAILIKRVLERQEQIDFLNSIKDVATNELKIMLSDLNTNIQLKKQQQLSNNLGGL